MSPIEQFPLDKKKSSNASTPIRIDHWTRDENSRKNLEAHMKIPAFVLPYGLMPAIGLGTWQMNGTACETSVGTALDLGYRHIDTAELYRNEREIGKAIASSRIPREEWFITSKVMPIHAGFDDARLACKQSLKRLQTDFLDLYLLHWPADVPLAETFRAFAKLLDEGKVRTIGVSNFGVVEMQDALKAAQDAGIQVAVNQVELHPGLFQKELLEYCQKKNVHVTAYSPVARGTVFNDATLKRIAQIHGKTVAQICLRWSLQHGLSVIPKASKKNHLRENLDVLDFRLESNEMQAIDALGNRMRLVPL